MKNLCKTTILLLAVLSLSATLSAAEDDALRASAEKFIRQICEKDSQAILQTYPMTDEFKAIMPDDSVIVDWATMIDRLFGRLGDVVNSEIVEHPEQRLRSVYLYYQGNKQPAKIWVTFRGTDIAGLHYNVWAEGYTEREHSREKFGWFEGWTTIVIIFVLVNGVIAVVLVLLLSGMHKQGVEHGGSFWLIGILFCGLVIGGLIFFGEREPTVRITDSDIRISGIFGVKIVFTEITDISLWENTIHAFEITRSAGRYGTSKTQKGYFRSRKYGSVLLFTRTNSSPTIHIQRKGKADVFLNFSDNEATRAIYDDMKTAFARHTVPRQ